MDDKLISKVPEGPLAEKWTKHKAAIRVVSPANKRKLEIIVVGPDLVVLPQPLLLASWDTM